MSTLHDLLQNAAKKPTVPVTNPTLQQACDNIAKRREENAVRACEGLITSFTNNLESSVKRLRQVRQQEKSLSKQVKDLDRAVRYFGETGNPLPAFRVVGDCYGGRNWCENIGIDPPDYDTWVVPDNYTPAEVTTVDEAATAE